MEPGSGLTDFVVALGLVMVIEGALYAAAPSFMKALLAKVIAVPDTTFRYSGLAALVLGVAIVWVVRG